jgi:hypothetical protein
MTMTDPTQPDTPIDPPPVSVAGHEPDPAIAANVDPQVEPVEPAQPRWVRFVGEAETAVVDVGRWLVGEIKHVPGWLAARLLSHPHFVEVDPFVAPQDQPAESTVAPSATVVTETTTKPEPELVEGQATTPPSRKRSADTN